MKNYLSHPGEILLTALTGAALRIAALYPAAEALALGRTNVVLIVCGALLYLFAVLPFRAWGFARLRLFAGGALAGGLTYASCLRAALGRFGRRALRGLPAVVLSAFWLYVTKGVDYVTYFYILRDIGSVFGGKIDLGYGVLLGVVLVSFAAAALLWWLDMESDFRDVTLADSPEERKKRREARKRRFGDRLRSLMVNILLTLPSLALWLLILGRNYLGDVSFEYGLISASQQLSQALLKGLPGTVILRMALILVVVHLPLAVIRKTRNASLAVDILEGVDHPEA